MKRAGLRPFLVVGLGILLPLRAQSHGLEFKGLISTWAAGKFDNKIQPVWSLRFVPELAFSFKAGGSVTIDAEVSANSFGTARFFSGSGIPPKAEIKSYRAWLRISTSQFEARAGLQKINFGSASLLRPLMWFDSIDPRDPLQITDGVYALLLRYYTLSNANFWIWGMYGNDKTRGWDIAPPDNKSPEFGGRVQFPLGSGELAATYHHRRVDLNPILPVPAPEPLPSIPEDRVGLDGKWDIGVGVWFEGTLIRQKTTLVPQPWRRSFNVGLDYTFGLGNGLNALAEHFRLESSAKVFGPGSGTSFSALLLRYPVGLLDEVTGIFYYDWKNENAYRFLNWQRTYDRLTFNLILFWNPEEFLVFRGQGGAGSFAGKGFEFLLAYHF